MIPKTIQVWIKWLREAITQPRRELDRWEKAVRFAYDMAIHGWRALNQDNASQMAAALAYRSLFALLPIVVVATVMVKALRGPEYLQQLAHQVIGGLGLLEVRLQAQSNTSDQAFALGEWLEEIVVDLSQLDLKALGWVGFAILVYAAITMMVTIENSFNSVYRAPMGRSWVKRITTYWFVLTLGPAAVALMIYVNTQFKSWIQTVEVGQQWLTIAATVWSLSMAWVVMFLVYWLIPNTRVSARATAIGALVAAVLLEIGRHSLGAYFNRAFNVNFLYGTLGAIPIVMFWMYLMWLMILFGLEVAATIQYVQTHSMRELEEQEKKPQVGVVDPAAVVVVMEMITERFTIAKSASAREITDETRIPETLTIKILERLVQCGMVHWVEGESRAVTLAQPPEQVCASRLIEIGFSLVDEGARGRQSTFVQRLRNAQKRLASRATLATLLAKPAASPAANASNQVPAA